MTMKTGLLTMLAGGIFSLSFPGAASAEHAVKDCESCGHHMGNAGEKLTFSDGEDRVIVIELDTEDGPVALDSEDFDFDFDFDVDTDFRWATGRAGGDSAVVVKRRSGDGPRGDCCGPKTDRRAISKSGERKIIIESDGRDHRVSMDDNCDDAVFFPGGAARTDDSGANLDHAMARGDDDKQKFFAWVTADDSVASQGGKPRVMIGVTLANVSEAMAAQLGVDPERVVMIDSVMEGMPAEQSGLRRFDIITSIDGVDQISTPALQKIIASKDAGDAVRLRVLRGGEPFSITIKLAEAQAEAQTSVVGRWRPERIEGHIVRSERDTDRRERTEQSLQRVRAHVERQRSAVKLRKERSAQDINAILHQLEDLDVGLDEETMAQLRMQLGKLNKQFEDQGFALEAMPNIEFFPGEDNDEAFVVIEGEPGDFQFHHAPGDDGKTFTFPGGRGEFRISLTPDTPKPGMAPGAAPKNLHTGRNSPLNDRLDSLEERMTRIEKLLERLADRID